MIGLFQEHGPCRITNDSTAVTHNPYSWNNHANMLYIDQPVGVGFSYGSLTVGTAKQAAADVWTFMQIFLSDKRFSRIQNRSLAIWTESQNFLLTTLPFIDIYPDMVVTMVLRLPRMKLYDYVLEKYEW